MKDCIKIVIFSLLGTLIIGGIVCFGIWVYECETQYKGNIQIFYTEETPKIIIKDYNCYKSDEVILYVPNGSIEFIGTMRIS